MLNAEKESFNEGIEVRDSIFASLHQLIRSLRAMVLIRTTIEEEAKEILTIKEVEVVEVSVVNLHSFILSIISNKVSLVLLGLDQIGLCVKFVESLVIWLWIAITGWTMLIKASIHL